MTPSKSSRWIVAVLLYSVAIAVASSLLDHFIGDTYHCGYLLVIASCFFFSQWDLNQPKSRSLPSRIGFVTLCSVLALFLNAWLDWLPSIGTVHVMSESQSFFGGVKVLLVGYILPSFVLGVLVIVFYWVRRKWFIKSPSEPSQK